MSIGAVAVGLGSSIIGGVFASDSAEDAQASQERMAGRANELSQAQYEQTRKDNEPTRLRGDAAGNRLSYLMGLSGTPGMREKPRKRSADEIRSALSEGYTKARTVPDELDAQQALYNVNLEDRDGGIHNFYRRGQASFEPTVIDEAKINEAIRRESSLDDTRIAEYEADLAKNMADPEYGSLLRGFSEDDLNKDAIYKKFQPGIDRSLQRGEEDIVSRRNYANSMLRNFGAADFEKEPGYEFRLQEGNRNIENTAAARGGLLSGAALKAMQRFGQDFASNEFGRASDRFNNNRSFAASEYNNAFNRQQGNLSFASGQADGAFNRFNTTQGNTYNRLAGVAGTGQQAINSVNAAGAQNAQFQGSNMIGMGNAQAASQIAQGNAMSGMFGQIGNIAQTAFQKNQLDKNNLMQQIQRPYDASYEDA
jgi:hypothetical protein